MTTATTAATAKATAPTPELAAPDLTGYLLVHRALRWGATSMAARAATIDVTDRRAVRAFVSWCCSYLEELHMHHTVEDRHMFPALVARMPEAVRFIDRTDGDHEEMDRLIERLGTELLQVDAGGAATAAAVTLARLSELMTEHLDFEDAEVLPLFLQRFTAEEYNELDEKAVKELGISKQALWTVPFIVSMATPEEHVDLWAGAPLPLRVIHALFRGRFDRQTAAALGDAAQPKAQAS